MAVAICVAAAGCSREPQPAPTARVPVAPTLAGLPRELTVKQRSTTSVPGSGRAVSLTVDDITRGQVMVSLAGQDGAVVLAVTSLAAGESAEFKLGDQTYHLRLDELNNELVGDDSATFVITDAPPGDGPATDAAADAIASGEATGEQLEQEKIRQLIEYVGSLEGAVFIRNGTEHTPAEAAEHLRAKWEAAAGEITTADEFIAAAASTSSQTGEPYRIRTPDGVETEAGEFLRRRLAEMATDE